MNLFLKAVGIWLFLDGLLSLFLCSDKKWNYQLIRALRIVIGIVLFVIR